MNKNLSEFNFISKYAHTLENGKKENWEQVNDRIYKMHRGFYESKMTFELSNLITLAQKLEDQKLFLSSQRCRQFAGKMMLKSHTKAYNCAASYADRSDFFGEIMWVLLNGAGAGFSVQQCHISKMPVFHKLSENVINHVIDDSIEGWADAIKALISSYTGEGSVTNTYGKVVEFDYSLIRPKGSLIANQFLAPGPDGLRAAIEDIRRLIDKEVVSGQSKLRSIHIYDIVCFIASAVLSGGVRRSATICMFSPDDIEMMKAKTGNWFNENKQRALSNNSAVFVRGEATKDEFDKLFQQTKEFGEPGFFFTESVDIIFNPCGEIGLYPQTKSGISGWAFCNLTEINGGACDTVENFLEACKGAAIAGTLQAGYNKFGYLGAATEEIVKNESLLGVSITGWMDNPNILFDERILHAGVSIIKETNETIADIIGIPYAARLTTVKPSGNASVILGTPSGIHGEHSNKYIRRVQTNKEEYPGKIYELYNPHAVEQSVWSKNGTDNVISFAVKSSDRAINKSELLGVKQLEYVLKAYKHWVLPGTIKERCAIEGITHNVSNTIQVPENKWDEVKNFIWSNRHLIGGVSLLSATGDLIYNQAAFSEVFTPEEIVSTYGSGAIMSSGLVTAGLEVFKDLWVATENATKGTKYALTPHAISKFIEKHINKDLSFSLNKDNLVITDINAVIATMQFHTDSKNDWIRRFHKFANNHFDGDIEKCANCLKHVHLWWQWCKLRNESVSVDWSKFDFSHEIKADASSNAATACSGGACEVTRV